MLTKRDIFMMNLTIKALMFILIAGTTLHAITYKDYAPFILAVVAVTLMIVLVIKSSEPLNKD